MVLLSEQIVSVEKFNINKEAMIFFLNTVLQIIIFINEDIHKHLNWEVLTSHLTLLSYHAQALKVEERAPVQKKL